MSIEKYSDVKFLLSEDKGTTELFVRRHSGSLLVHQKSSLPLLKAKLRALSVSKGTSYPHSNACSASMRHCLSQQIVYSSSLLPSIFFPMSVTHAVKVDIN